MAQYNNRRFTYCAVIAWSDQPSEPRLETEHVEVTAGNQHSLPAQSHAAVSQIRPEQPMSADSGKHVLRLFEIAKHRVTENNIAVAGVMHDCEPGLGPGAARFTSEAGWATGSGRSRI